MPVEEENRDEEEQLEDNEDVMFEGDAMQDMRVLDVDDEIIRPSRHTVRTSLILIRFRLLSTSKFRLSRIRLIKPQKISHKNDPRRKFCSPP